MDHPNSSVCPYSAGDDSSSSSSVDPMFSGVTLQSILSFNPSLLLSDPSLLSLNLPSDETLTPRHYFPPDTIVPKCEPPLLEYPPSTPPPPHHYSFYDPSSSTFLPLPQLHSLESFPPPHKRPRSLLSSPQLLIPHPPSFLASSPTVDSPPGENSPAVIPQSHLARQRRQKLSDKTRCLQKLMPWDKKMDQATLLEEACKYVKFLQAQFNALQSMPSHSAESSLPNGAVFGDLERLNRNQVLQVLVNSPVAQTRLYSQGFCVFSVEQLTLLANFTGKTLLLPQYMSDHDASPKSFFN